MFYLIAQTSFSVLSGIGKPGTVAKITLVGAVLNIVMNITLIPLYGITGAAIATSVSYVVMAFSSTIILRKYVKITLPIFHWLKTIFISALMLGLLYWLKDIIVLDIYPKVAIIVVISGIFYIAASYLMKQIDSKEIKNFIRITMQAKN